MLNKKLLFHAAHIGIAVAAILYAPWWVALIVLVSLLVLWRGYEVPALALLSDFLYMPPDGLWGVPYLYTFAAIIALMLATLIKRNLLV